MVINKIKNGDIAPTTIILCFNNRCLYLGSGTDKMNPVTKKGIRVTKVKNIKDIE